MQQLILKNDLPPGKMDALLNFLKQWGIDAEVKSSPAKTVEKESGFTLSVGIWKDYAIDAQGLRKQAWERAK
jgi:hypothetical protein